MSGSLLYDLKGVSLAYSGHHLAVPVQALRDVDLEVREGEMLAVAGPNASGKTTLALLLAGVLAPSGGRLGYRGGSAGRQGPFSGTAVIFQDPDNVFVAPTLEEDVAFGPENAGLPPAEIRRLVDRSLDRVGLGAMALRHPATLSGGQKQMAALAGCLACRPSVIILDEATAYLDPWHERLFLSLIGELRREGATVIMVTQESAEMAVADRLVVLRGGRIAADGPPAVILGDPARRRSLGLEEPAAAAAVTGGCRPPRASPVLSAEGLGFVYPADPPPAVTALAEVTFDLAAGECTAVVGGPGAGKSTLARNLAGLLQPTTGRILLDRVDIPAGRAGRRLLTGAVGYAPQRPERQLFAPTVAEDVAAGLDGAARERRDRLVDEALALAGLEPAAVRGRPVFSLSGGEARKVALAGAVVRRRPLLILDEPTAGLDPVSRGEIALLLGRLKGQGHTLMVISHRPADALAVSDRLMVLEGGRLSWVGPAGSAEASARLASWAGSQSSPKTWAP